LRPSAAKEIALIEPIKTVGHHRLSQLLVGQLVRSLRVEEHCLSMGHHFEVKMCSSWPACHRQLEVYCKSCDFLVPQLQAAAVFEGDVEGLLIVLEHR
jgi:hypothetical protein